MYYKLHSYGLTVFFLFCILLSAPLFAQRLEIHGIKDLSNDKTANKAWGVGGAVLLDQWVKKTTFGVYFDWTTYRPKNKPINPRYDRMSAGILVFYSINISKKFSLQCGADINYTNLKHSYIHSYQTIDTVSEKPITLQQTGDFIGIGAYIGANYEFSSRFGVKINVIPTYLISVGSKSSSSAVAPEYAKGIWMFPLKLGLTYKIFNSKE